MNAGFSTRNAIVTPDSCSHFCKLVSLFRDDCSALHGFIDWFDYLRKSSILRNSQPVNRKCSALEIIVFLRNSLQLLVTGMLMMVRQL